MHVPVVNSSTKIDLIADVSGKNMSCVCHHPRRALTFILVRLYYTYYYI
jgi:hypothetical protein